MDAAEQIKKFGEFFEKHYHALILETIRKGETHIVVDFSKLSVFDPGLANELLEQPEEVVRAAEIAVENFDSEGRTNKFRIRLSNLPESQKIMIRHIRSKHLGKMYCIDGVVRQKSDVRPQVTAAKFECPSCGNTISVLQLDKKFKEPSKCGCGRKGKFRLLSKELIDAQGLVLEESPEDLEGGEQPKRMNVFLKDDLVSPMTERHTNPGSKVIVVGFVKEIPLTGRDGGKLTRFDLLIEANYIESVQEDFYDLQISKEEEDKIIELANDPKIYSKLRNSIAPSIYGYEEIKDALALQLVGGLKKTRGDGSVTRGDMHVLLIGDPGAGKCVHGDTKIFLETGEITTMKAFHERSASSETGGVAGIFSINEMGLNFTSQPARFWRRKAPKEMLKITTNTGNELIVTKEHPLFTTKNGFIFAKEAKNYKKGEDIATTSKIDAKGELQPVSKDVKLATSKNKVKYNLKHYFDADFARLFGYLVGDGYVRVRKTTGLISFTNNNSELLDDFERLIKSVFNLKVSKRMKQG
ncbi:LAGLIDADG family homing endonuclease, partial [Nanoarchaeota archaeon]